MKEHQMQLSFVFRENLNTAIRESGYDRRRIPGIGDRIYTLEKGNIKLSSLADLAKALDKSPSWFLEPHDYE